MRAHVLLGVAVIQTAACGPSVLFEPEDELAVDATVLPHECDAGERRCDANAYQVCINGVFVLQEACAWPQECSAEGCVDRCTPGETTCIGNEVRACKTDGSPGELVEACGAYAECVSGACVVPTSCSGASEDVYVVDSDTRLYRFKADAYAFELIGALDCPASAGATPFSMSVDRMARAWVLYTSGEMFMVSTADASCEAFGWEPGSAGFHVFGMGFVTDTPGGETEKLFISSAANTTGSSGAYAWIDPDTLEVTYIGTAATTATHSPELTGTGAAELYSYFPGSATTYVARVDKSSGAELAQWPLPPLNQEIAAWAFAHWGGDFFVFVTTGLGLVGDQNPQVWRLDPETGTATRILAESAGDAVPRIVGAGVSTCAPIDID